MLVSLITKHPPAVNRQVNSPEGAEVILPSEKWMDLRRYRPLHAAGATYKEIAAEVGCDWRTMRKCLADTAPAAPPLAPSRAATQPRKIEPVAHLIDKWLTDDPELRASVIHERLVAEYDFDGHYQRVKTYAREVRDRLARRMCGSRNPRSNAYSSAGSAGAEGMPAAGDAGVAWRGAGPSRPGCRSDRRQLVLALTNLHRPWARCRTTPSRR